MTSPLNLAANDVAFNFTRLFGALRAALVQQLLVTWTSLGSYRDSDLDDWLNLSLPIIQAGHETAATATATYLDIQMQLLGVDSTSEIDFSVVTGEAIRNGVPSDEVYSRPFKEVWDALSRGQSLEDAIENGANRLRQLIETDVQLVHTHTSRDILSREPRIQGFRRVPTGPFTCALCLIASTQRYKSFDLMPIHPGCDCRVAPVTSFEGIPQVIDKDLLEEVHKAIEKQFGISARDARKIDYRKILTTYEHGEFGPTLAVRGQHHTIL